MSEKTAHEHEGEQVSARTVVVAEDEALIRLDIVEILKDQGFEVVAETDNGKTAIELAKNTIPIWCSWMSKCRLWTVLQPPRKSERKK